MNIDLDHRAWFDAIPVGGVGVHVVEGAWPKACPLADPEQCNGEHCDCPLHPPPEWVALSEQKCETCRPWPNSSALLAVARSAGWEWCSEHNRPRWDGSSPCEYLHSRGEEHEYWCPIHEGRECVGCSWTPARPGCPDCLGSGRPLVVVTVPALCSGMSVPHSHDFGPADCNGRVSIGSVTAEAVVPIVRQQSTMTTMTGRWLAVFPDGLVHWQESDGVTLTTHPGRVDLGSNSEQYVGKFGVIVRRVS